jgi:hypothetical protein
MTILKRPSSDLGLPQAVCVRFNEGLLVRNDILVLDRGQDPHLIYSVFLLLLREVPKAHFLQGVDLVVRDPLDLVHLTISAITYEEVLMMNKTYRVAL